MPGHVGQIGLHLPSLSDPIRRPEPFDNDDYIFELKMDGFRSLAYVGEDQTRLVSRRGNVYRRFTELAAAIHVEVDCKAVLDGEIVCLDSDGRPQFYDLLRRRETPVYYAFDVLWCDGEDLRTLPLIEQKRRLRRIVPKQPSVLLHTNHVERTGVEFFRIACEQDLEGIVAKVTHGAYGDRWFKIRNPSYSQYEGRRELFERTRGMAFVRHLAAERVSRPR